MTSARNYKFKIWNLVEKKMYIVTSELNQVLNKDFNTDQEISISNAPHYVLFGLWEPCVIMQFTGKQDIRGVDIYDQDIIKRNYKQFDFDTNEYNTKEDVSYIEYLDRGFWIKDESFGWEGEDLWDWNKIEVIGNMFETPELYYLSGDKSTDDEF